MKVGLYESDITPPLGCYQSGYGFDRKAEEVYTKLYSKALVIEQDGEYAVVISVDICEYPTEMNDIVAKRIYDYTGITPDRICIHSTHDHCGAPVTDDPAIECYRDDPYTDVFYRLVADSAILAFKRLEECEIKFAKAIVPDTARSRCYLLKDGTRKTHESNPDLIERPSSYSDNEVPILFIEKNGKKLGALYTFGCHQDTVGLRPYGYCGDYSSIVSEQLKDQYGRDFVSIYLAAPSGDMTTVNVFAKTPEEKVVRFREVGRRIAEGIKSVENDTTVLDGKLKVVKEKIEVAKRKLTKEQYYDYVKWLIDNDGGEFRISNAVHYQSADHTDTAELYLQIFAIGDFALYVYPGEMFNEYTLRTKKNSPFKFNMVAENSNAYGGYIPTPDAFDEKSVLYEISLAYDSFLVPEAGDMLCDKIIDMAKNMKNS